MSGGESLPDNSAVAGNGFVIKFFVDPYYLAWTGFLTADSLLLVSLLLSTIENCGGIVFFVWCVDCFFTMLTFWLITDNGLLLIGPTPLFGAAYCLGDFPLITGGQRASESSLLLLLLEEELLLDELEEDFLDFFFLFFFFDLFEPIFIW